MNKLLVLIFAQFVLGDFDIDDSVLYKVNFPGFKDVSETEGKEAVQEDIFSEETETYTMITKNKEKYECRIPMVKVGSGDGEDEYSGPSPLGIIEKLFIEMSCTYRLEAYWTYELCHGRFLRQYHEERDGKDVKVQEYFLGKFSKERLDELVKEAERDKENDITRHPPTKKIESLNLPYFEITMEDGTLCDLNNAPRRTRVLYICYPTGRNEVYQLKETSTCEYEVIILTSTLCSHPSFKPSEVSEHGISCRPVNKESGDKPSDLISMEAQSSKLRSEKMWEAHMHGGDKPGQVKIEIRPLDPTSGTSEIDLDSLEEDISSSKSANWRETVREPIKPLMDPEVVKQFLRGEYCLYGGSGWWKYEFCYGKKVDQYHQGDLGSRTVIKLGVFELEKHLNWIQEHPNKKPKMGDARKHVSHFYSSGDICDLTGNPRHIEVKLKCKKADSPSAVTLYLLEPKPCEYVLGVESPLVCDILPLADTETGLIPQGAFDRLDNREDTSLADSLHDGDHDKDEVEDDEGHVLTKEERKRLADLKQRIRQKQSAHNHEEKGKTPTSSSSFSSSQSSSVSEKTETKGGKSTTVREEIMIINGVRTTIREVLVDGVVDSSEIVEEEVVHFVPEEDKMKPVEEESPSTTDEDNSSKDEL